MKSSKSPIDTLVESCTVSLTPSRNRGSATLAITTPDLRCVGDDDEYELFMICLHHHDSTRMKQFNLLYLYGYVCCITSTCMSAVFSVISVLSKVLNDDIFEIVVIGFWYKLFLFFTIHLLVLLHPMFVQSNIVQLHNLVLLLIIHPNPCLQSQDLVHSHTN